MINYFQAVLFGLVQGITELFPISSLGHSVLLPKLVGWTVDQKDPSFLTFLIATHAATAFVLFLFFIQDWKRLGMGIFRSLKNREINEKDADAKLAWILIVTTIPAGLLGVLFEEFFKNLFASPNIVAIVLVFNGGMLFIGEILRRKSKLQETTVNSDKRLAKLTWIQSIQVGFLQCIALIPGFSRTGATITGGLLVGLSHEDAVRFSFLLATPIIGAAAVLKLPELATQASQQMLGPTIVGAVFAGCGAYFSVRFLIKYFKTEKLWPFAVYCVLFGILALLVLLFR